MLTPIILNFSLKVFTTIHLLKLINIYQYIIYLLYIFFGVH